MRIIIYGVGAIGGAVAATLSLSGQQVVGIARGAQLAAIKENGLLLRTSQSTARAQIPCVADPKDIKFRKDDLILLTMKTQDTLGALENLQAAGITEQPIFCVQNGVTNERMTLRRFGEVHGVTVMMPASISAPGEICVFSGPRHGIFDLGRYPNGYNAYDEMLAQALEAANIAAFITPDVMQSKYGKLLLNLSNIVEAAFGRHDDAKRFTALLRVEAERVYEVAGISWQDQGHSTPRREELLRYTPIKGMEHSGNSTVQSFLRGTGSVETDYLNGEIVLLGRLHGVPTPANSYFVELSRRMLRNKLEPGTIAPAQAETELKALGLTLES